MGAARDDGKEGKEGMKSLFQSEAKLEAIDRKKDLLK